jgi:hypothetical protein
MIATHVADWEILKYAEDLGTGVAIAPTRLRPAPTPSSPRPAER